MTSMRGAASKSYNDKLGRMGLGTKISTAAMGEDEGIGHALPALDGSQGEAEGGRAEGYETEEANERMVAAKKGTPRLDRPGRASGGRVKKGSTTVNVIVANQSPKTPPMMPPMPPAMPMPPPPPDAGPGGPGLPGAPGGDGPPMMMGRASGGRVPMKDGAGGGKGRLQKIKEYGDRAKVGGKAGTM